MPDFLGPIEIPDPPLIDDFPVRPDFGSGMESSDRIVTHLFDQPGLKTEQRFYVGDGARRFHIRRASLSCEEYEELKEHFATALGVDAEFYYDHPKSRTEFEHVRVRYGDPQLTIDLLAGLAVADVGITLTECPQTTPTLTAVSVVERIPDAALNESLRYQAQKVIPLIIIWPRPYFDDEGELVVPDPLRISDRRCTLAGADTLNGVYLPRLLEWRGVSQSIGENSDAVGFAMGNADRVWFSYTNQIDLTRAQVSFALYFDNDDILLKLWGGYIQGLRFREDETLEMQCSDGVYELNLPFPVRQISRSCWKQFADGVWCPYSATHIDPETGEPKLDGEGAPFSFCPKTWEACQERGMTRHFGGIVAEPQAVTLKSKGHVEGKSNITSVSVRSDSVYGRVLREVYNDTVRPQLAPEVYLALPAHRAAEDGSGPSIPSVIKGKGLPINCDVAAGRNEAAYYSALGIVGEGPITEYHLDLGVHLLDKKPPHNPKEDEGFREVPGREPITSDWYDFFGFNEFPWSWPDDHTRPDGSAPTGRKYPAGSTFAAGTAFVEMKTSQIEDVKNAKINEREMLTVVTKGLGGWIWTAPGAREWKAPLTNPIWICINIYLKALGLKAQPAQEGEGLPPLDVVISAEVQEARFDVQAAIDAAEVCDEEVPLLEGWVHADQKEIQFPFRGVMEEQKPLRDWIQEVLNCCLGYYTFNNSKLRLGLRFHSGTDTGIEASKEFTIAQILHRSLQAEPVLGRFNYLAGEFGDEDFDWKMNSRVVYDPDNAAFYGGPTAPRYTQSSISLPGVSNKSQCLRIVATRLWEELGGRTRKEQREARNISFRTTVLALGVHVGDICAINHPRLPNGRCEFRVQSWRLNADWSIDIQGSSTCDSMYDLIIAEKPGDSIARPVPAEGFPAPLGVAWLPNEVAPFEDDPMLAPTELNFSLRQNYPIEAEGTYSPAVIVRGEMPVVRFLPGDAPAIRGIEFEPTGGELPSGQAYYFAVAQRNDHIPGDPVTDPKGGSFTQLSNYAGVRIPRGGTDTNKVVLEHIQWRQAYPGYGLWGGTNIWKLSQLVSAPTAPLPETLSISGPLPVMTRGAPNPTAKLIRIKAREVYHSGIAGIQVMSVTGPNQIQSDELKDSDDPWVGQLLSVIADSSDLDVPLWNFEITGFDAGTGTFTVTPNCVGVPTPSGEDDSVEAGDVMIVRSRPTAWTNESLTNDLWANDVGTSQFDAVDGLVPGYEVGLTLMIIAGTGKGQIREIVKNDNVTHWVTPRFTTLPDATSVYIITWSDWVYFGESAVLEADAENQRVEIVARVTNSTDQTIIVGGFLVDVEGRETFEHLACYREIYIYGEPYHVRTVTVDEGDDKVTTQLADHTIRVDTTAGDRDIELLPVESYFGRKLLIVNDGTGETPGRVLITPRTDDEFQNGEDEIILEAPGDWAEFIAAGDREETRESPAPHMQRRRRRSWHRRKLDMRRDAREGRAAPTYSPPRRRGPMPPPDRKGQL